MAPATLGPPCPAPARAAAPRSMKTRRVGADRGALRPGTRPTQEAVSDTHALPAVRNYAGVTASQVTNRSCSLPGPDRPASQDTSSRLAEPARRLSACSLVRYSKKPLGLMPAQLRRCHQAAGRRPTRRASEGRAEHRSRDQAAQVGKAGRRGEQGGRTRRQTQEGGEKK
jgi:hypothetical protein